MELFTPDFGLIFWMFIAFGILFLILWKCAWPVILKSVDSRADLIDKGVEYAQEAKERLDGAQREADDMLREARRRQAEAQKVMDAAKASIAQQQKEAEQALRANIGTIALDIAGKVMQQNMAQDKAQRQLVDKLLTEIESNN